MASVGIRELKLDLSKYLKRVGLGERITVTDRGRPIAVLVPIEEPSTAVVQAMIADGTAHWTGGKPRGSLRPARLRSGPSVAQTIGEDRG
jgi:prevent-host-death family protein